MGAVTAIRSEKQKYTFREAGFKRIMFALTCASILNFAGLYFVHPIMPLLVRSYNISSAASGLALSVAVISMIIGLLFFGFLSDRMGRTRIMHITLVCTMIPLLLMPLVPSFEIFLVLRFVQGFFMAGLPAAAIAYISEEVAPGSINLGITLYIAANGIGGMIGRIVTGYMADRTSWQISIYILFGFSILLFLLYFITLPKSHFFQESEISFKKDLTGMLSHLNNKLLFPAFAMGILLQFSFTGVWSYLPFYLEREPFGLAVKDISFTYLAYTLGMIGPILAGRMSIFMKKTTLVSFGTLILISGSLLTNVHSLSLVVVGLCLTCFGFFIAHSLMAAIVNERATHHKGGASSLYLVSYYLGVATGGSLTGLIWQNIGWTGVTAVSLGLIPIVLWLTGSYGRVYRLLKTDE
ncbi:MFS transporter [Bacillus sp. ISL-47]|uniref:MFS transporter n=1 Tax=Bacillus sp. ISL-47 TaxID=2819130 RepID=UPI001BE52C5D|nr:MFS transporter [Bacillus sp. ISL-47]MBT2690565.1 MFS transporter [Bacillus sp. ISL-47]MBT2710912.1 MFS transporter [Pseudomonas sp. ISL-84]